MLLSLLSISHRDSSDLPTSPSTSSGTYIRCMPAADSENDAKPGLDPNALEKRGDLLYTLDVDGQLFEVRRHEGGTDYDWVTGPNEGYGFGTSGRGTSEEWHRDQIRDFMSMIDPATGYIGDA